MTNDCLDMGIIQAFMDCELTHEGSARVSGHIAVCDACARQLAEAEEESAFVFTALEREMDTLVPTQRLWSKINDSIAVEKSRTPWWQKAWAALGAAFVSINPSVAVAASLILVAGISAIVLTNRGTTSRSELAQTVPQAVDTSPAVPVATNTSSSADNISTSTSRGREIEPSYNAPRVERAAYRPEPQRATFSPSKAVIADAAYLPGEESYVKTISTLAKTADQKKDQLLGASERVAFERNMAIVNDSISKLRKEVKRNPRNESAKQVLYSSYQNKIDLLNSVAQKEDLIASVVD